MLNLRIVCRQSESNGEFKAKYRVDTFNAVMLRDLCYYLIRKQCYPGENTVMPPKFR